MGLEIPPGLQIRGSKFRSSSSKFRELELQNFTARSRLYRSQILQVNTRWKALAEIYTIHSFAPFPNLNFFVKNRQTFFAIELMNLINSIAKESNFAFFFCEFLMNF